MHLLVNHKTRARKGADAATNRLCDPQSSLCHFFWLTICVVYLISAENMEIFTVHFSGPRCAIQQNPYVAKLVQPWEMKLFG